MEDPERQPNRVDITHALSDYAEALKLLAPDAKLSARHTLKVLRARDRVQEALSHVPQPDDDCLAKLVDLDLQLKQQADVISRAEHLDQLRQSLQPPQLAWWWYLDPIATPADSKPRIVKFDWFWNVGTVVCLVLATSFISQTAKAFSSEGFDFLGTLSTISQGAGLAAVAGGALTDKGRQAVSRILTSVKVPPSLHAEATFGAALLLLGASYGINQNLHVVGGWYFQQGRHHEKQGAWSQAFKSYQRALNFAPDDYKTQIAIGFLHEKLGNFERAVNEYKKGTAFGIPEFLNAQARAMLMGAFQKNGWQGGIDKEIIREVESLLVRARKSTENFESAKLKSLNPRLRADIGINQSIATLATLKPTQKLDENTQNSLSGLISSLLYLRYRTDQSSELTEVSTVGNLRAECYRQQAYRIGDQVNSKQIYGVDVAVASQALVYSCTPLRYSSSQALLADATLLESYRFPGQLESSGMFGDSPGERILSSGNISALMDIIYYYGDRKDSGWDFSESNLDKVILIKEPSVWLGLSSKLSNLIRKNYVRPSYKNAKQHTIWRFILSKSGQIIAYFSYDPESLAIGQEQSFLKDTSGEKTLKKLGIELKLGKRLEFADFKVVISQDGKILHILPWAAAYPAINVKCKKKCRNLFLEPPVKAVFKSYTPNLNDTAELHALNAVLDVQLISLSIDTRGGWYYEDPSIFKLKASSDGQIVDYQAVNQIAVQKFGKDFPVLGLKSIQFPELQKAPYAYFKLEAKGFGGRLTPWSDSEKK